jgi:hypothetical protein
LPHFQSLHDCVLHLQLALAGLLQTEIFSAGGILLQLPARFDATQLSADSADCREELDWQMGVQVATQE